MIPLGFSDHMVYDYVSAIEVALVKLSINIYLLETQKNGHHLAGDIFKDISLNENFWISNKLHQICSLGSNWQCGSIGSDNDQALSKRQAIFGTSGGLINWCINVSPGLSELQISSHLTQV